MNQPIIIIPSRMHSTRLPGKAMKLVQGVSLVQRVYGQCLQTGYRTVVATDSTLIAGLIPVVEDVVMTPPDLRSGSDRVAYTANLIGGFADNDIIVNVQGDMPFVPPELIHQLIDYMVDNPYVRVATPVIRTRGYRRNSVTVAANASNRALYFSRSSIPWGPVLSMDEWLNHVGVYAYRAVVLRAFSQLPEGVLEKRESLEQLRFIENGIPVHVMETKLDPGQEVNTQGDLEVINNG